MNTRPTPLVEAPRPHGPDDYSAPHAVAAEPTPSPLAGIVRLMRGRWLLLGCTAAVLSPALAVTGFLTGTKMYSAQAILRVYPQQSSILYDSGDDSVLKTFDSFVKAETTYVASTPVMGRATETLKTQFPDMTREMNTDDLTGSIAVKRSEALIVLDTSAKDPAFAAGKLTAVTDAYLALTREGAENLTRVRLEELTGREKELSARAAEIDRRMLEVGGEYGPSSLAKVHVEKVGQIDALVARKAEVEATLDALKQVSGASGADMADEEIMRATLLDRALADLNFDRAKREAEMISLKRRFAVTAPEVTDKLGEIEVLDRAMAERREQIKLLGQTGALTDTSSASATQSTDDIQAVLDKVSAQLAEARAEARALNAKRVELESLEAERVEVRYLLEETRKALEVLRLESNSAMPGLTVLMSPAAVPSEPSDDSSKMQGAMGLVSGFLLAVLVVIGAAMAGRKLRYSDALWKTAHRIPVLRVIAAATQKTPDLYRREIDRLRNALKLLPARTPAAVGRGRVIAVTRLDGGSPDALAQELANSFARARMRTLLVQANGATGTPADQTVPGWYDALHGLPVIPQTAGDIGCADLLPAGDPARGVDTETGINAIRRVLGPLAQGYEVVIVNAGGLSDNLAAELILSASDFALAEVMPGQNLARIHSRIGSLDTLPRNGGAVVVTGARRTDPGLAA
jgi:polysaccharide biosynthesis transport protein